MRSANILLQKCLIRFSNQYMMRDRLRRAKSKKRYFMYKAAKSFYDIKQKEY
jgi:hypothetical protein